VGEDYDEVTVVKYLYDGDHCIAEYDGNDELLRKFIYGPGVDLGIDYGLLMIDYWVRDFFRTSWSGGSVTGRQFAA